MGAWLACSLRTPAPWGSIRSGGTPGNLHGTPGIGEVPAMNKFVLVIVLAVGLVVGYMGAGYLSPGSQQEAGETATTETADAGAAGSTVRWKMPSTFPGNLVILGTGGKDFVERLREVSDNTIQVQFFEPGALVPALEIFDAVSTGAVDAGWSTPGYWAGKVPALQFFTAVPFGPLPGEVIAWLKFGGGDDLFRELYSAHNIHPMHCMMISPEASGWFRNPIESVEDLQGLKMRFFGLGAKVMEKLGVSTQLLAGGDIYPALDLGTIDATEFAQPVIDLELGFYQVAKHYYLPGWHQPTSFSEFIVNMERWNELSLAQKAQVETTCAESILTSYGLAESLQPDALVQLEERGVNVHQWEPEFLALFENAWNEVVEEEAAKNADFARVWASLSDFREKYNTWGDRGYLP